MLKTKEEKLIEDAIQLHAKHMRLAEKPSLTSQRKLMDLIRDAHTLLKRKRTAN